MPPSLHDGNQNVRICSRAFIAEISISLVLLLDDDTVVSMVLEYMLFCIYNISDTVGVITDFRGANFDTYMRLQYLFCNIVQFCILITSKKLK
jgi:hypothetical protein